ncbi:MAG: pyridoxamine 5'-phosphate oxidase [Pseudomonadota bacterium]
MLDHTDLTEKDPFVIARDWLAEAEKTEINDPNAMALSTVDADGLPNVRIVLLKGVDVAGGGQGSFVFYTNYTSTKAQELDAAGKAAFVIHWKSLRRQIRVRGRVEKEDGPEADAYYATRSLLSRHGAWASDQSAPLESREVLLARVQEMAETHGENPPRPPYWGGYRITPTEIEFWSDGEARLHNRFRWRYDSATTQWTIQRLNP